MTAATLLGGRRVLVTRTREAATGLVDALHAAGADVAVVPLLTTVPVAHRDDVAAAVADLAACPPPRWVALTSATAVRLLCGAVPQPPAGVRVAAVGDATAASLRSAGWPVDLQPQGAENAASLADALQADALQADTLQADTLNKEEGATGGNERGLRSGTVLFPAAEGAHRTLPEALEAAGAEVRRLTLYRTEMPPDAPRRLAAAFAAGPVDAVLLTSGSAARHLVRALGGTTLLPSVKVVCIGEQTAADARAAGLEPGAVAMRPNAAAMVEAVARVLLEEDAGAGH